MKPVKAWVAVKKKSGKLITKHIENALFSYKTDAEDCLEDDEEVVRVEIREVPHAKRG